MAVAEAASTIVVAADTEVATAAGKITADTADVMIVAAAAAATAVVPTVVTIADTIVAAMTAATVRTVDTIAATARIVATIAVEAATLKTSAVVNAVTDTEAAAAAAVDVMIAAIGTEAVAADARTAPLELTGIAMLIVRPALVMPLLAAAATALEVNRVPAAVTAMVMSLSTDNDQTTNPELRRSLGPFRLVLATGR